ncbi:MAG: hypothetical protein ACYTEQ_08455 [Planctomycetota bacterium]|jgi:hypothetical protein
MSSQTQKWILLLMFLTGCGSAEYDHLTNVTFRIVDEATGVPLSNREMNICKFVYFKLRRGSPSPYLQKDTPWYIASVRTDENGRFNLDLRSIDATYIVVEPGEDYDIVRFERSSDLAHTKSADHIRVVRFEKGTTRVVSNMIYDLKQETVKIISTFDKSVRETGYEEILLAAKSRKDTPAGAAEAERNWKQAEAKWLGFVEPYLKRVREEARRTGKLEKEPDIGCVELRSFLISKYLPDYKLYIIETGIISFSKLFAVSSRGEILDLKSGSFGSVDPQKEPFTNEAFSEFLKRQQIRVADANTAIETGKLIEEIVFAPGRWMYLKYNSKNFSVFKMCVFYNAASYWQRDWAYYADRQDNRWIVSRRYIGPPASIGAPRRWEIAVDKEDRLVEVYHR